MRLKKHGETLSYEAWWDHCWYAKRLTHLVNCLSALDKPVSNEFATNKFLICLNREWKSKVTAIKETNDLSTLNITTLFGKLEEHEQELISLEKHEKKLKKDKNKEKEVDKKSISLKASSSNCSTKEQSDSEVSNDECSDDEEMGLFVFKV